MAKRKVNSTNYINQSFLKKRCPLNELIYLMGRRWVMEVLSSIEDSNNRFSSIKDDLKFISDHILANRLRLLETNQFITSRVLNRRPPRVEYMLTEKGTALSALLHQLRDFTDSIPV